jgi:hypothetical protein
MANEKKPSLYEDRGNIGSPDELDEYGVWVKSAPQDVEPAQSDTDADVSSDSDLDLPDFNDSGSGDVSLDDDFFSSLVFEDADTQTVAEPEAAEAPAAEISIEEAPPEEEISPIEETLPIEEAPVEETPSIEEVPVETVPIEEIQEIQEPLEGSAQKPLTGEAETNLSTELLQRIVEELEAIKAELSSFKIPSITASAPPCPELEELMDSGARPITPPPEDTTYLDEAPEAPPPEAVVEETPEAEAPVIEQTPEVEEVPVIEQAPETAEAEEASIAPETPIVPETPPPEVTVEEIPEPAPQEPALEDINFEMNLGEDDASITPVAVEEDSDETLPPAVEDASFEIPIFEDHSGDKPLEELPADTAGDLLDSDISLEDISLDDAALDDTSLEESETPAAQLPESKPEPELEPEPAAEPKPEQGVENIALTTEVSSDLKSVLSYMDELLEYLPEDKIEEFTASKYYPAYKKLFEELGLA